LNFWDVILSIFWFMLLFAWIWLLITIFADERTLAQAQRQDQALRQYVQDAAVSQPSAADELAKLATLRDQGAISEHEFAHAEAKVLGTPSPGSAAAAPNPQPSVH